MPPRCQIASNFPESVKAHPGKPNSRSIGVGYKPDVKKRGPYGPLQQSKNTEVLSGSDVDEIFISIQDGDEQIVTDQVRTNEKVVNDWPKFWPSTKLNDFATSNCASRDIGEFLGCPSIGSHVEVESGTVNRDDE